MSTKSVVTLLLDDGELEDLIEASFAREAEFVDVSPERMRQFSVSLADSIRSMIDAAVRKDADDPLTTVAEPAPQWSLTGLTHSTTVTSAAAYAAALYNPELKDNP